MLLLIQTKSEPVCDVNTGNEWIDDLLVKKLPNDPLDEMVANGDFDLILTFTSGGYDVIYPRSGQEVEDEYFAGLSKVIDDEPPMNPCGVPDQPSAIEQKQQTLSDRLYSDYRVPMFAIRLGCCGMPANTEVATVWRSNIDKILNFVYLSSSGVEGNVLDANGTAIRSATISVDRSPFAPVTKNMAHLKLILLPGPHSLVVRANGFNDFETSFTVAKDTIYSLGSLVLHANDDKREHHQYLATGPATQISGCYNSPNNNVFILNQYYLSTLSFKRNRPGCQ